MDGIPAGKSLRLRVCEVILDLSTSIFDLSEEHLGNWPCFSTLRGSWVPLGTCDFQWNHSVLCFVFLPIRLSLQRCLTTIARLSIFQKTDQIQFFYFFIFFLNFVIESFKKFTLFICLTHVHLKNTNTLLHIILKRGCFIVFSEKVP